MKNKIKTIQLHIPDPCGENWNEMHPLPGGRFCDTCEKTIVDFTEMTDNEIARFYQKNNHKICGRFRLDQLEKDISLPRTPSKYQKWKAVAAIAAGLMTWTSVGAQTNITTFRNVENIQQVKQTKIGKKDLKKSKGNNWLKGIIKDTSGEPLIGANIILEKGNGTATDFDGKFELEIPTGWESFDLTISYVGYETQVIEFSKNEIKEGKELEFKLEELNTVLDPVRIIGYRVPVVKGKLMGLVVSNSEMIESSSKIEKEEKPKEVNEPLSISNIYPNPFVQFVNVKLQVEKEETFLFHLYNTNGQLIWAKTYDLPKGSQELRLDFSNVRMAQGNHFLRVTDGKREIQTKKIIKVNSQTENDIQEAMKSNH